jgi:hypothetical protein
MEQVIYVSANETSENIQKLYEYGYEIIFILSEALCVN